MAKSTAQKRFPTLIIIDMQKCMRAPAAGPRNNICAESNIRNLLQDWRKATLTVVHVRHISRMPGSVFWPGQAGVEFQEDFMPLDSEHVVEKNIPDAFALSGLERWLRIRSLDELIITGVSTNNSVESTARSAGNLGFRTTVVSDATFAYDKLDFSGRLRTADEVHAMALGNLQGEYASIRRTAEVLALLNDH